MAIQAITVTEARRSVVSFTSPIAALGFSAALKTEPPTGGEAGADAAAMEHEIAENTVLTLERELAIGIAGRFFMLPVGSQYWMPRTMIFLGFT